MHHQRPVKRRLLSTLAIMSISALLCSSASAERNDPADWSDIRSYTPALALGIGVTFDQAEGMVGGDIKSFAVGTTFDTDNSQDNGYSGGAIDVNFRLMLPEFEIPTRPRLFVVIDYTARLQKNTLWAEWGSLPNLWPTEIDTAAYHTDVSGTPGYRMRAALGASFNIPNDYYPIRFTTSLGYATSKTEMEFSDWMLVSTRKDAVVRLQRTTYDFITHDIAPGIGLDVEIDRVNQISWGFFAEFYAAIPLNTVEQSEDRVVYSQTAAGALVPRGVAEYYAKQGASFQAFVGLRLSWVGRN